MQLTLYLTSGFLSNKASVSTNKLNYFYSLKMVIRKLCNRSVVLAKNYFGYKEFFRELRMHSRIGPSIEEISLIKHELHGKYASEKILSSRNAIVPVVNNPAVRAKRSALFSEELERQKNDVGRIEKIEVQFEGKPESANFLMNKSLSTPYNCAQHLSEVHVVNAIVAEVNGQLWDMHKPLESDCKMRFLTMKMKDEDPYHVNRVFWRSCSLMLGCIAERAFQESIYVELHSFPSPNVRSGSFVYDVDLKIKDWNPNSDETRVLSAELRKLAMENLPFERLEVKPELAMKIFEDNKYKREQIPEIAATSVDGNTICLYRLGDFVDISKGPMMSSTGQLGRATVTGVFPLRDSTNISDTLYRLQGVALPHGFLLNHVAWGLIESRGRKFNSARLPGKLPAKVEESFQRSSEESLREKQTAMLG